MARSAMRTEARRQRGIGRRPRMGLAEAAAKGALAGVAGGVAMLVAGELEARGLLVEERREEPAVKRRVRRMARSQGVRLSETEQAAAGVAVQLLAAAAVGAVYGMVRSRVSLPPASTGALLGALVWAGNRGGVLPKAGLFAMPQDETLKEALVPAGAHAVFGLTTARVFDMLAD